MTLDEGAKAKSSRVISFFMAALGGFFLFPMVDEWKDLFYNYSIIHSMTREDEEL